MGLAAGHAVQHRGRGHHDRTEGRVTFLNPVAESLTGRAQDDAHGKPLETVFQIINQDTRKTVESPTVRALRDGVIVGLANHTLLISKDGTERPIDDSAAPIRNERNEVAGVVLVFRDISERYRQERTIQDTLAYANNIIATLREPFLVINGDLKVQTANRSFYENFRVTPGDTEGRFVYDLGNGQWNIPRLRTMLGQVLVDHHPVTNYEVEHDFPTIGRGSMLLNALRIRKPGNHSEFILLAIEDVKRCTAPEPKPGPFVAPAGWRSTHHALTPVPESRDHAPYNLATRATTSSDRVGRDRTSPVPRRPTFEGPFMRHALLALLLLPAPGGAADPPLLLQRPTVSEKHVVFVYAGDLWVVDRAGGDARRLTAGVGLESYPVFSPDGARVAFAGEYEGNLDVYVVPVAGGVPNRLTHHPDPDVPVAWTPDGKSVLFRSPRTSHARFLKLFAVPVAGGQPSELPLPQAEDGSLSTDGKRIAYVPLSNKPQFPGAFRPVRNYRGGTASPLWIADLSDSSITKVPRNDSNDFNPMWVGETVYFLSDRDGPTTLFGYDAASKQVKRALDPEPSDIKSASACADAIVYDRFGTLHLFDLKTRTSKPIPVRVTADLPGVRPKVEKVNKAIQKAGLSPTGTRALFEARGEVLTVPAEKGDARNLTNTTGAADRDPAWSPDGKSVAYFSDESGEYELCVRAQDGRGEVKRIKLGDGTPSFFYSPVWSPDGKKIAYGDKRINLWYVDLDTGKSTKVDTGPYDDDLPGPAVWSPDSKWLAYPRQLKNYLSAVFLYSLEAGKAHQVTDGMSDARYVAFDKNGKYLYFTASTDIGPSVGSGMSIINRPVTRAAYVVVLSKDDPSPLAPESDDEKEKKADEKKDAAKNPPAVRVDAEDLDQRTLALPAPPKNYVGLLAGKAGTVFLVEGPAVASFDDGEPPPRTVHRFDLEKRKSEKLAEAHALAVSDNGEKMLYRLKDDWFLVGTGSPAKPGDGAIKLDGLEVRVDPRAEWRQIYREVYRVERDFLYDPGFHGFDLKAAWDKHESYLDGLGSRHDLNYLLDELLAGLSLQHVYLSGGDVPRAEGRRCGLLGADYAVENGRHRITRVYRGESWNPGLRAPLTQPGAGVKEGEYLLAVNGREVRGEDEVYRLFEGTAGKQTVLKVGPSADGKGSREVVVVPVGSERQLRNLAWIDANRRAVDKLTGGRIAYVYLPDTAAGGYTRFNRYFFAQAGREGVIVDERFNGGGLLADHVIDYLRQPVRNYATTREGADQQFPTSAIPGPKVMLINEQAGSGGDYLPYTFRQANLGQLVGKRTWGGLVGIGGYPPLVDGGGVTAPRWGIWFPSGKWEVENRGVAPDVEVEFDPKLVRQGKDPQLEKAIEIVLAELEKYPVKHPARPPFPNYHKPGAKDPAEGK